MKSNFNLQCGDSETALSSSYSTNYLRWHSWHCSHLGTFLFVHCFCYSFENKQEIAATGSAAAAAPLIKCTSRAEMCLFYHLSVLLSRRCCYCCFFFVVMFYNVSMFKSNDFYFFFCERTQQQNHLMLPIKWLSFLFRDQIFKEMALFD